MMLFISLGNRLAQFLLDYILPRRWADRIYENAHPVKVVILKTGQTIQKPPIGTLVESVFATLLFDLALFGTDNIVINSIIRIFTKLQNSWDKPFMSRQDAHEQVLQFCTALSIPHEEPWIWEKQAQDYTCLNDFFSRTYAAKYFPTLGEATLVSPACCTMTAYQDDKGLKSFLIKACNYQIQDIGLYPPSELSHYAKHAVLLGYLSPTDYHRVHAPIEGTCIYQKLEGTKALSASVKFFNGKFNLLNENKRLVLVLEQKNVGLKVALVVVGGVGVNTIVYDPNLVGTVVQKGQQVATFRAGGSAIAIFSNQPLQYTQEFKQASANQQRVQVLVGESVANYTKQK